MEMNGLGVLSILEIYQANFLNIFSDNETTFKIVLPVLFVADAGEL